MVSSSHTPLHLRPLTLEYVSKSETKIVMDSVMKSSPNCIWVINFTTPGSSYMGESDVLLIRFLRSVNHIRVFLCPCNSHHWHTLTFVYISHPGPCMTVILQFINMYVAERLLIKIRCYFNTFFVVTEIMKMDALE